MKLKRNKKKIKNIEIGLVTGAAGLLGEIHCESILENYAGLIAIDIHKKNLLTLYNKLKVRFPKKYIKIFNTDITNAKRIENIDKILNKENFFVRVLINNACIDAKPNVKKKVKTFDWFDEFNVSLRGSQILIEYFSKHMKVKKDGCILNIASDLSVIAPNQSIYRGVFKNYVKPLSYSVIKHGLIGLTKYYSALLGEFKITCNAISPAGIYNKHNPKFVKNIKNLIPMKRMATKHDVKNTVDFLINKKQKFITGQNILIDGGRTII